jgi:hypothetical protein
MAYLYSFIAVLNTFQFFARANLSSYEKKKVPYQDLFTYFFIYIFIDFTFFIFFLLSNPFIRGALTPRNGRKQAGKTLF